MKYDIGACKKAKTCKYGCMASQALCICDYLKKTGQLRTRQPKGEIVNGSCGLYAPKEKK